MDSSIAQELFPQKTFGVWIVMPSTLPQRVRSDHARRCPLPFQQVERWNIRHPNLNIHVSYYICSSNVWSAHEMQKWKKVNGKSFLGAIVLVAVLGFMLYPSVYAWGSSPQISYSTDGSGSTILSIQFSFAQMSNPPTQMHHPFQYQVRISTDGSSWTELPPISISPWPTTTVFTETYNLGSVSGTVQAQARLDCIIHGWSDWGPDPPVPVPEFSLPIVTVESALLLAIGLIVYRKKTIQPQSP